MDNGLNDFLVEKMYQKLLLLMSQYPNQKSPGAVENKNKVGTKKVKNMVIGQNGMTMSILNPKENMTLELWLDTGLFTIQME